MHKPPYSNKDGRGAANYIQRGHQHKANHDSRIDSWKNDQHNPVRIHTQKVLVYVLKRQAQLKKK